jgi:hypothetical protein
MLAVVVCVAVLVIAAGRGGGSYTNDVARATIEFEREVHTLILPHGMRWPPEGPMWMLEHADLDPDSLLFEDGFGTLAADTYYLCAWETAWILEPSGRRESLQQVAGFKETHAWRSSWDDVGRQLLSERLVAAGEGRSDEFIADVIDNCPGTMARAVTRSVSTAEAGRP